MLNESVDFSIYRMFTVAEELCFQQTMRLYLDTSATIARSLCRPSGRGGRGGASEVRSGATALLVSRGRVLHDPVPLPAPMPCSHATTRPGLCRSRSGNLRSLVLHFCACRSVGTCTLFPRFSFASNARTSTPPNRSAPNYHATVRRRPRKDAQIIKEVFRHGCQIFNKP